MKPQNVIIVNEAKGNVNLYHVRVDVGGVPLWTGVYAETIERANRVVEKLFGKGKVKGRPVKVKESKDSKGPKNKVEKGSQKRYKNPLATDDPEKYIGKWEAYDEPQGINSKTGQKMVHAEAAEEVVLDDSVQEGTLGPEFSHGLTNSSTGRGAVPTETPFEPKDLPNVLRPRKKQPGSKAPTRQVQKTVGKSTKSKVRRPNAPVTEVASFRIDELFGSDSKLDYEWSGNNMVGIELSDDAGVMVGFESINNHLPEVPPGVNVGFSTMTAGGDIMLGLEREQLGMDRRTTIALFNTIIEVVRTWVERNKPDRVYFIAVEPMKNIYPKLIDKFVPMDEWTVTKGRGHVAWVGQTLDVYKLERKDQVDEMVRLPIRTKFNADYEIKDCEHTVGMATVTDGVIEELKVKSDPEREKYKGHWFSVTLGTIVRDADLQNANLAMQIPDVDDLETKRFLERFGFRHTGEGIFKRTAGAITPPSVIEKKRKKLP